MKLEKNGHYRGSLYFFPWCYGIFAVQIKCGKWGTASLVRQATCRRDCNHFNQARLFLFASTSTSDLGHREQALSPSTIEAVRLPLTRHPILTIHESRR